MYIGDYGKALKVKGLVKTTDLFKKCWEQLSGMEELSGALERSIGRSLPAERQMWFSRSNGRRSVSM